MTISQALPGLENDNGRDIAFSLDEFTVQCKMDAQSVVILGAQHDHRCLPGPHRRQGDVGSRIKGSDPLGLFDCGQGN